MWLVVLGRGTFATLGKRFPAGVHEVVDDDVIERIRASKNYGTKLLLTDVEPSVVSDDPESPLTVDDIKVGTLGAVRLDRPDTDDEADEPDEDEEPGHGCPFCPQEFPVADRLERHIEFHHGIQAAEVAEAEVEPEVEAPPWEVEGRDETAVNSL